MFIWKAFNKIRKLQLKWKTYSMIYGLIEQTKKNRSNAKKNGGEWETIVSDYKKQISAYKILQKFFKYAKVMKKYQVI